VAAATRNKPPRQRTKRTPRKMFMPYEPAAGVGPQPPTELAHITDEDELFEALTDAAAYERATGKPPEKWYRSRFIAETGRSEGRFKVWMSNHYAVLEGADPAKIEDRIMVKPDGYDRRSPWWYRTTADAWAIEEGLKTRGGVTVPYKPTGRPKGKTDSVPRQRTATMKAAALEVLAEAEKLTAAGATAGAAKAELAKRHGISERAIKRRLTEARAMRRAGVRPISGDMTPAEVGEMIVVTYRLLMADGRRSSTDRAREDTAERLGVDRDLVDRALDGAPPAVLADTSDPHVMTRGEAQDIVAALGGEVSPEQRAAGIVADLTRGRT
jgi:hypothetical protein